MSNGNGNGNNFWLIALILGFVCLAVWWIEDRFGTTTAGYVLLGVGLVIAVVVGWVLSLTTQKATLNAVSTFARNDATTDRYRMMSFKESLSGEAAERKANATIAVLDAKRVDQLAQQRANLMLGEQRTNQKQLADQQAQQEQAQWWQTDPAGMDFDA